MIDAGAVVCAVACAFAREGVRGCIQYTTRERNAS